MSPSQADSKGVPSEDARGTPHSSVTGDAATAPVVVSGNQLSPADGRYEAVESLADEMLQSLLELKRLARQVEETKNELEGHVRYVVVTYASLAPTLTVAQPPLGA